MGANLPPSYLRIMSAFWSWNSRRPKRMMSPCEEQPQHVNFCFKRFLEPGCLPPLSTHVYEAFPGCGKVDLHHQSRRLRADHFRACASLERILRRKECCSGSAAAATALSMSCSGAQPSQAKSGCKWLQVENCLMHQPYHTVTTQGSPNMISSIARIHVRVVAGRSC